MRLHLFDFDGTISNSDSMFEFLKFISHSNYYFILFKCIPLYIKFKLGIISKKKFKTGFLIKFLSKFSEKELKVKALNFIDFYKSHLKKSALEHINNLKKDPKNEISIVSASLDLWIKPIAKKIGINFIATISEFKNNSFNGIDGENCNGKQKVLRIKETYRLEEYTDIYAYGDSEGDLEMLKIANHKNFRTF